MQADGERIYLKSFTYEEFHELYGKYVADPVMDPNKYVYDKAKVDERYLKAVDEMSWYARVGIFLHGGAVIGELSFKRIDRIQGRCEIGIALAHDGYKRQGYGSEAMVLAIGYAFDELGLRYIYADTMGSNVAMRKILDKLGFQLINIESRRYDMGDRWEDKLNYVLERSSATAPDTYV